MFKDLARQFPACRAQLARRTWEDLRDHLEAGSEVTAFPELVDRQTGALKLKGSYDSNPNGYLTAPFWHFASAIMPKCC